MTPTIAALIAVSATVLAWLAAVMSLAHSRRARRHAAVALRGARRARRDANIAAGHASVARHHADELDRGNEWETPTNAIKNEPTPEQPSVTGASPSPVLD